LLAVNPDIGGGKADCHPNFIVVKPAQDTGWVVGYGFCMLWADVDTFTAKNTPVGKHINLSINVTDGFYMTIFKTFIAVFTV